MSQELFVISVTQPSPLTKMYNKTKYSNSSTYLSSITHCVYALLASAATTPSWEPKTTFTFTFICEEYQRSWKTSKKESIYIKNRYVDIPFLDHNIDGV